MYSLRPCTEIIGRFLPASTRYGEIRDPEGTEYPSLFPGQDPRGFNFFEASSIRQVGNKFVTVFSGYSGPDYGMPRSEEHTSELQSRENLVCRLLLEKKKT